MAGKPERGGRPKSAEPRRAYQVKLPLAEAAAFDEYIRRREAEVAEAGGKATASSVLHTLIRRALADEGLLEGGEAREGRKGKAKR